MKRAFTVAALVSLAAVPLLAGGRGSVSGAYVEARTAEVFTGGCIMNSEAETVGKQAVLAWKVDRGTFNGIAIDGLSVVAAVAGDRNLGTIVQVTPAPIEFADHGGEIQVTAGPASLDVSKHLTHDPTCGAMQWFHPLASVDDAAIG